ncbi:DUF6503 family protein [uncultured Croceitalea sp.]|uniref:DUF6503 family protein n=1 Tax=uncultured Croceitalea sp. TaxID=1798908 RepID=UPI00330560CA
MRILSLVLVITFLAGCKQAEPQLSVQEIVDNSIADSGGKLFASKQVRFSFRDREYTSEPDNGKKVLKRTTLTDSLQIRDVKTHNGFQRFFNDSLIALPDSVANRYANSVNSVHYFVRLPLGLNDPAVHKSLLGEVEIGTESYYKVKVTFSEANGGEDFDDVYVYWFNKKTFKPDFLAYEFHVNGGGIRFREAYNERYVNGIRFVDYNNYRPKIKTYDNVLKTDSLFLNKGLDLLSKIELKQIEVE